MATVYRCQFTIAVDSGIEADSPTNTWHFRQIGSTPDLDNIRDMLEDFYTTVPVGQTAALDEVMSPDLSTSAELVIYDLSDPEPRVPVATYGLTLGGIPATGTPLPHEVSCCLSYRGDYVSGVPKARNRGRIFLGPFTSNSSTNAAGGRPASTLTTIIRAAARDMLDASNASLTNKWVVYSPTKDASSTLLDSTVDVVGGWVDNAWDTQRRRGVQATSKLLWDDATP